MSTLLHSLLLDLLDICHFYKWKNDYDVSISYFTVEMMFRAVSLRNTVVVRQVWTIRPDKVLPVFAGLEWSVHRDHGGGVLVPVFFSPKNGCNCFEKKKTRLIVKKKYI